MVNWPLTSAFFGTLSIGSFLSIITLLSVYRALSNQNNEIIAEDNRPEPLTIVDSKKGVNIDSNSGLSGDLDSGFYSKISDDSGPDSTNPI